MKNLILLLAILSTLNATAFLDFKAKRQGSASGVYSKTQLKALMASNKVACLSLKKDYVGSKGYISKFGDTPNHCTTNRAKVDGVKRLNKNNLDTATYMELSKQGLI